MSQPITKPSVLHTLRRADCPIHGPLQPFYFACTCVVKFSQPPTHVLRPSRSPTGAGEILCKRRDHEAHEMLMVCVHCASENEWNKVKGGNDA